MAEDNLEDQIKELRVTINDYIDVSLENQRKKRAENIQVLVSLGIIGAFFTSQFQSSISGTSFESFIKLVVISSGIFLLSKVIFPTIRLTRNSSKLEWFDQVGIQFFYMFSVVLGSLTAFYLWSPPLSAFMPVLEFPRVNSDLIFKMGSILVSLVVALLTVFRHRVELKEMEQKEERLEHSIRRPTEADIMDNLAANPEKIKEGIEIVERNTTLGGYDVDFVAEDEHGSKLIIEVKKYDVNQKAVSQLEKYVEEYQRRNNEEVKGILVASGINEAAKRLLDDKGWEFIRIRPRDFL